MTDDERDARAEAHVLLGIRENRVCEAGWQVMHSANCDRVTARLLALRGELAQAEAENMCDACAGTGEPTSGRSCMCSGSGKASDAATYLREQYVMTTARAEKAEAELAEARSDCATAAKTIAKQGTCREYVRGYGSVLECGAAILLSGRCEAGHEHNHDSEGRTMTLVQAGCVVLVIGVVLMALGFAMWTR